MTKSVHHCTRFLQSARFRHSDCAVVTDLDGADGNTHTHRAGSTSFACGCVALYVVICPSPDVFVREWTLWACHGPLCAVILLCFHHLALLKCGAPVAHNEGMDVAQPEKVPLYQGRFFTQVDNGQSFGWVEPRRRCDASRRL
jgi:hypothetical protein